MLKGAAVYHNHGDEPLSPQDIAFLYTKRCKEIHATTFNKDYIAHAPKEYKNYTTEYIISKLLEQVDVIIWDKMTKMNSKEADMARANLPQLRCIELCKLLHVRFVTLDFK